jgi:hypothetical protein
MMMFGAARRGDETAEAIRRYGLQLTVRMD